MTARPPGPRVRQDALWFGLLGGGAAWTVHLLSAALISEWGCLAGKHDSHALGISAVAWGVIAVSLVTALVAAAATWVAVRARGRLRDLQQRAEVPVPHERPDMTDPHGTGDFLARAGAVTSGTFLLIILVETIPILFFLQDC